MGIISCRIDDGLYQQFKSIVTQKGMKVAFVVSKIIEDYVKKNQ